MPRPFTASLRPWTRQPPPFGIFPELFDVDVQQFPGGAPGADSFAADRVQFPQPRQPGPGDDPGDHAGRDLAAFSQLNRAFTVLYTRREDLLNFRRSRGVPA
jgi:hypothetical protein